MHRHIKDDHEQDASDNCDRDIAFRVLDLAGHERKVVPAVITPQRSKHRRGKARQECVFAGTVPNRVGDALAGAGCACQRKISKAAARHKQKRPEPDKDNKADLDRRQCRSDLAAQAHRKAVECRENRNYHHGDDLQRRHLIVVADDGRFEKRLF